LLQPQALHKIVGVMLFLLGNAISQRTGIALAPFFIAAILSAAIIVGFGWFMPARTAEEMAQIPTYYVMEKDKGMAETVAPFMPSAAEITACKWLTEGEVEVYATEYGRSGFTGALQGYRVRRGAEPKSVAEMLTFSGRTIDVPSMYIAGKSDWGVYQTPGAVDKMRTSACTHMVGFHLLDGAGHWVQQEQPEQVSRLLVQFLHDQH